MSFLNTKPDRNIKEIKVARCAKKTCKHNTENKCKAFSTDLAEMGCFSKFTGSKKPVKEEPLDKVFS